uniref:Uncharacterized protein n=1 Tax=Arundo donax TaxID=35708 RepID=A0A0A8YQ23_ARUDO
MQTLPAKIVSEQPNTSHGLGILLEGQIIGISRSGT